VSDERTPDEAYRRLPRVSQLRPRARATARELAEWRERTAQSENRPVGSVLADVALVEVARRQPQSIRELEAIRGVRRDVGRRRAGRADAPRLAPGSGGRGATRPTRGSHRTVGGGWRWRRRAARVAAPP